MLPILAAILVLVGSFRIVSFSDLSIADNVFKFQISFGFMALGYVLAWHFSRRLVWLMIFVAAVARIAVLPIEPGSFLDRRIWEGKVLASERSPYELAPDSAELEFFRGPEWEGIQDKDQVSSAMPGMLWIYSGLLEFGGLRDWIKPLLIVFDLLICMLFAFRFGADRAALYAWNPLVVFCVGGLGVDTSLFLLPVISGYLLWEFWIDHKGGVSAIKAAGGIGSALGKMVCLSAFLIGVGISMNLLALPILIWIVWHVLRRSGISAGMITLIFGAAPLVLGLMWASISLNIDLSQVLPGEFRQSERGVSLIPHLMSLVISDAPHFGGWFLFILFAGSLWMIHRCETLERFTSYYIIWALILATSIYPWSFLTLAIVGVGSGNYVFRVASLSVFAYFGAYRVFDDTGIWQVPWTLLALLWVPFLIAAIQFTMRNKHREGFYVHSF